MMNVVGQEAWGCFETVAKIFLILFPIVVDPSHATGLRDKVGPMARAAVAAGADGLMVEVHPQPERALSDGAQSLDLAHFEDMVRRCRAVAQTVGRTL